MRKIALTLLIIIAATSGFAGYRYATKTQPSDTPTQPSTAIPSPTPAPNPTPAAFNKTAHSLDTADSIWWVVNKTRPLNPINYAPADLTAVGNGQQMRSEAATALSNLFTGAKTAGHVLTADSAYRSYNTQVSVYNAEVTNYGQAVADTESARPGHSEHQTGLAVDIGSGACHVNDCFGTLPAGIWTNENAYKYGFIKRYPEGKTAITGYRAEAWHFRYVGIELSTEMHDTNIETLEEFFGLPAAPDYK